MCVAWVWSCVGIPGVSGDKKRYSGLSFCSCVRVLVTRSGLGTFMVDFD
jgi:hypothetical protein